MISFVVEDIPKIWDWKVRTFNDSERIDCLENEGHCWQYVKMNSLPEWFFECAHCFKKQAYYTNSMPEKLRQMILDSIEYEKLFPDEPELYNSITFDSNSLVDSVSSIGIAFTLADITYDPIIFIDPNTQVSFRGVEYTITVGETGLVSLRKVED